MHCKTTAEHETASSAVSWQKDALSGQHARPTMTAVAVQTYEYELAPWVRLMHPQMGRCTVNTE